jgi:CDP-glucose 4,6-dehydratase
LLAQISPQFLSDGYPLGILLCRYSLLMNSNFGEALRRLPGPVLVTGHTGFKGTWLTLLLERLNIPVVGISLPPEPDSLYSILDRKNKIEENFIDIRNLGDLQNTIQKFTPSAVLHMAAQPLVLESYESPLSTFETNVIGTANLLQSCLKTNSVETIGVITTDKVYKNLGSGRAFIESDPLEGRDPYSASKVGAESVITAWREISNRGGGPQIFSLRAGNVIGGGDRANHRLLPDIVKSKLYEKPLLVRNPQSARPWQHVLDPLHGYLLALEKSMKNEISPAYNFGPAAKSLTVENVINIANKAWGNSIEVKKSDNSKNDKYEAGDLAIDASLSHKELGWSPIWSQEGAVTSTINWWKQVSTGGLTAYQSCLHDIRYLLAK